MFVRDKGCCNKTGIVGGTPGLAVVKLLTAVLGSDCAVIDSPVIFQKNRKYKTMVNGTENDHIIFDHILLNMSLSYAYYSTISQAYENKIPRKTKDKDKQ